MNMVNKFNLIKAINRHFKISYFRIFLKYISNKDKPEKVIETNSGISFLLNLNSMSQLSLLLDNDWKAIESTNTY